MLIELRAPERLRGPAECDVAAVMSAVLGFARESSVDLSRLRVVCDWVQYRHNFRQPVEPRTVEAAGGEDPRRLASPGSELRLYELAIDLRRAAPDVLATALPRLMSRLAEGSNTSADDRVYLEPWCPGDQSCTWQFNSLYWKALAQWEASTGRGYELALPGGESDGRNQAAARELILQLFKTWDDLAARGALPDELHVLELGVGNGGQARTWLDEFLRLDGEMGRDYYRRLQYLMGDYSPHVLELARQNVRHHAERVSSLVLDATRPTETLGFLRYKTFLVFISNVYDNLPTAEVRRLGGQLHLVQVRAYLPLAAARQLSAASGLPVDALPELVGRLLRLGPELLAEAAPSQFATPLDAVAFWRTVWQALCLEERFVPMEELDTYHVAPGISGEMLRPIAEANGDLRMHVSNGAAASFADTLPLLHPLGLLQCHDLFVTDIHQYTSGFHGPGKYEGSVVNWVNGPILAAIGRRRGFDVSFAPFAYRKASHVLTLTARVRD